MNDIKHIYSSTSKLERLITLLAIVTLIVIQFNTDSSLVSFLTAFFGTFYVICVKYKSRHSMILGLIQCSLYFYLALSNKVFGDVFLNAYNICFLLFGYFNWKSHTENSEVEVRSMNGKNILVLSLVTCLVYLSMFSVLSRLGGFKAYLDAFNTTFSCIAMALCCLRYRVQWFYWNCVNISSLVLYTTLWLSGASVFPMCIMFALFSMNSIHATYIWNKKI